MRTPRVDYNLGADLYRAEDGLSHSESRTLRKSPYHLKRLSEPRPPEMVKQPTAQQAMGTMVHVAALEPHAFDQRYMVGPDINKNSNEWKRFASECMQQGAEPISQQQRDVAFAMAASVRGLPDFAPILEGCATEVSLWWKDAATGVVCKARPDVIRRYPAGIRVVDIDPARAQEMYERGFAILGDVKTTDDASADAFTRSVCEYSYHTQADWYATAVEAVLHVPVLSFVFAVVEREFPYAGATYTLDDNAMKVASDLNAAARSLYAQCVREDRWPSYSDGTRDIALPAWYMRKFLAGEPS